jgi:hypothetical protein
MKEEIQQMRTKMEQLMQKVEDLERFSEHSNERLKNE